MNGEGRERATDCCVKYNPTFSEFCKMPDMGSDPKPLSHVEQTVAGPGRRKHLSSQPKEHKTSLVHNPHTITRTLNRLNQQPTIVSIKQLQVKVNLEHWGQRSLKKCVQYSVGNKDAFQTFNAVCI